ncbi:unnamed protein product [Prunus armeniaca]
MAASSSSSLKIEQLLGLLTIRLTDDNFLKWNYQIESVLEGYDLFGHFDGSTLPPPKFAIVDEEGVTSEVTTAYKDWMRTDKALLSLLIASLSDEAIEYVIGCKTARDAWLSLTDCYASVSRARINHLKTEFQTVQKGGDSVERFLLRLKHLRDQLHAAGTKISDDDFIIAALNGLPLEYDIIKTILIARDTPISLKDFRAQLLAAEQTAEARLTSHSALFVPHTSSGYGVQGAHSGSSSVSLSSGQGLLPTPTSHVGYSGNASSRPPSLSFGPRPISHTGFGRGKFNGGWNFSSPTRPNFRGITPDYRGHNTFSGSKFVPECQICNKRGHTAVNCFFRHANSQSSVSIVPECQICGKRGHGALDCYHRSNYSFQGQAPPSSLTAMTAQTSYSPEQVWIADSGATHHMVGDVSQLQNVTPCVTEENVTVGNGEGLNILHIGTSNIPGATSRLTMPSVFHVPQLKANLLSVHQLCKDNNCYIVFDVSGFLIQDRVTHQVLLKGKSDHGLYPIPLLPRSPISSISSMHKAYVGQKIKSSLWHQRLGHTTNEVTKKMLQASAISASDDISSAICSACLQGKMHRLSFPTSHSRATMPFQCIHSDVWGPSAVKSIDGYRYYVNFVDECTGFMWLYPIFNKSDVFGVFKKFYAMLTNQYDAKVKTFQTDGGGEFTSTLFTAFLDSKGVNHHLSCPHTPQQNGLAERKNRHVIDTAITLLSAASLPTKFWVHSVAHAVYLINRMPSEVLNHQSPFLKLFGHAPNVQHLRVFGTAVYPYLRCYNVHKLQPRTAQCVFMGYAQGYKGVLCFNMLTGKFVVSRHVLHDETVFPFANKMSSSASSSSHGNSQTTPILVSIPIPVSSSTPAHSMSLSPSGLQPAVSQDVFFPHQVSNNDPISRASSSNDSIGDRVPLVSMPAPVLRDDQLQVLLPASS